jgi:outer membrane protein assembly factor BamA
VIDLHWKRFDKESQILNITLEEPFPFGLPIGVSISYLQNLREGNFVHNESLVGIVKTVPGMAKFGFGGKLININSTEKGDSLGIKNLKGRSIYLSGRLDLRNDYWLPTSGYYFSILADIGERTSDEIKSINTGITTEFGKYINIYGDHNLAIKANGHGNFVDQGKIHDGELIRYGGANNLRGYTEDVLKSEWVIISTLEYNYNISQFQNMTIFTDLAIQNQYDPLPSGIGIGYTQVSKNSIFKIEYGLGRGNSIKNGKIHLQYLTRL